ncbi:MAG: hypothetical protein DPW09_13985 [Anaerolineae bacterium]|nr:hypothetical protein [Anaerolineae bacterium]
MGLIVTGVKGEEVLYDFATMERGVFQYRDMPLVDPNLAPYTPGFTTAAIDYSTMVYHIAVVTTGTIITYAFYTFSASHLPANHLMMLTIPFVIYGIFRYLYVIHAQGNGGAPDEVLLTDRPLQISIALFGLTVIAILYWL